LVPKISDKEIALGAKVEKLEKENATQAKQLQEMIAEQKMINE